MIDWLLAVAFVLGVNSVELCNVVLSLHPCAVMIQVLFFCDWETNEFLNIEYILKTLRF